MADDAQPKKGAPAETGLMEQRQGDGCLLDLPSLVAAHAEVLYRYAFRLSGSAADAEDLTQQTFLIAHQKLGHVREADCVRGWLLAVLRRTYLKAAKRSRPVRLLQVAFDIDNIPQEVVDHWEIDRELLQAAIDELPDANKLVLLSYYFEDLSYREIAERFGLPIGTVMSRLSRAKDHLRTRLLEAELVVGQASGRTNSASNGNGR